MFVLRWRNITVKKVFFFNLKNYTNLLGRKVISSLAVAVVIFKALWIFRRLNLFKYENLVSIL